MIALAKALHAAFHKPDTQVYRYVQGLIWSLILLSILLLVVEIPLPEDSPARAVLRWADRVLLMVFALGKRPAAPFLTCGLSWLWS